jgi:acyl carrier protein
VFIMTKIDQEVMEIVAQVARKNTEELCPETRLAEDLILKSMSRIELAALLCDKFEISLNNFEIRMPKTVEEVIQLVNSKL